MAPVPGQRPGTRLPPKGGPATGDRCPTAGAQAGLGAGAACLPAPEAELAGALWRPPTPPRSSRRGAAAGPRADRVWVPPVAARRAALDALRRGLPRALRNGMARRLAARLEA